MVTAYRNLLVVACLAALPTAATADDKDDFDREREQYSDFWEQAIHPHADRYLDLLARAEPLIGKGDSQSSSQARALLRDAIRIAPDRPGGYRLLARLERSEEDYAACAAAYGKALSIDPDLAADKDQPAWQPRFELADCQARAGQYPEALDGLRRLISTGHSDRTIDWRLGQVYMALGRLDEAIESLERMIRSDVHPRRLTQEEVLMGYTLAVALDRAEQTAESRRLLSELSSSRNLSMLTIDRAHWVPAADEHYTLGLVYLHEGDSARALHHMRRYLLADSNGPWRRRAIQLYQRASAGASSITGVSVRGSARFDSDKARAAVLARDEQLQTCLAPVPGLLVEVTITRIVPGETSLRARAGVRVTVEDRAGNIADSALTTALACVESVAGTIDLPKPTGSPGTYAATQFLVVARGKPPQ